MTVPPSDDLGGVVGAALVGVHHPGPPDRLLQRGADDRVERLERVRERLRRHPQVVRAHAVEALGGVAQGGRPAAADVVDDRADLRDRRLDVELGPGQVAPQLAGVELAAAQVQVAHHPSRVRARRRPVTAWGTGPRAPLGARALAAQGRSGYAAR